MNRFSIRFVGYLRGGPPLRQKAAHRKQTLNKLILDELTVAAIGRKRSADFSDLVGRWTDDPAFDEVIAAQRQIDPDKWK